MRDTRPSRLTRVLVAAALLVATGLTATTPPTASAAEPGAASKTLTFEDGSQGKVTVSKTQKMRREAVRVDWSGFVPTNNAGNLPYNALSPSNERFTVALMQCRGTDPVREDCVWGDSSGERYAPRGYDPVEAADPTERPDTLLFRDVEGVRHTLDPCVGTCQNISDHPADWYTFGRQSRITFTGADGTGGVDFEVRTGDEMPNSLGCGRSPAAGQPPIECSLVVVPIRPMGCTPDTQDICNDGTSDSYTQINSFWFALSGSNWRNRAVFPLSFLPPEGFCPVESGSRLPMMGAETATDAIYRWVPALCSGAGAVPTSYTPIGEGEARRQYNRTTQNFVVGSRPIPPDESGRPTAFAPVAISGFAFTFMVDRADNLRQLTDFRLNARLVAKLITQSYRGRWIGQAEDGKADPTARFLPGAPETLFTDKEFLALNPDLGAEILNPALSTPILVTGDGDVPNAVIRWLLADPEAAAFLKGEPDPWHTTVNPAFRDWATPADEFDYRDSFVGDPNAKPDKGGMCKGATGDYTCSRHPQQLGEMLAQRSSKLRDIAPLVQNALPLQTTLWDTDNGGFKRAAQQNVGVRGVIGITDLAGAIRSRLPIAKLSTGAKDAQGKPIFVGPTPESMLAAVRSGVLDKASGVVGIDYAKLDAHGYPGTKIDYAAVATSGLTADVGGRYAKVLEYAAGAGQVPGPDIGNLPEGYLPLPDELRVQTTQVAAAVRAQKAEVPTAPFTNPAAIGTGPGGAAAAGGTAGTPGTGGTGAAPGAAPAPAPAPSAGDVPVNPAAQAAKRAAVDTRADRSGFLRWGLPIILALGLLAAIVVPLWALGSRPGNPVHRLFTGLWSRMPGRRSGVGG
ncbi:hypothetical protein Acsp05_66910 [Actinokineospora sp. NBRC 105648]|nr:hypothetical protein Acsp05_66910 [Actinokineospora sp. NBRC 105648]